MVPRAVIAVALLSALALVFGLPHVLAGSGDETPVPPVQLRAAPTPAKTAEARERERVERPRRPRRKPRAERREQPRGTATPALVAPPPAPAPAPPPADDDDDDGDDDGGDDD